MNTAEQIGFALQPAEKEFNPPALSSIGDLMLNIPMLQQIEAIAERMANGKCTIPKHLQGNAGDCYAVAMQAIQWRMNPYSVAQKTHISPSGALGYEAQLINAAITTIGPLATRPEYEFIGDWSKILGKVQEKTGQSGGKYYAPAWNAKDEEGLGVKVSCLLRGETKPREVTVMLSQCYPRFSTQWATDPQQQITYVAVRKWARRYTPDVILGVYTPEELDAPPVAERDITPQKADQADLLPEYSKSDFDKNFPQWKNAIESGKRTADQMISTVSAKFTLTEEQKKKIKDVAITTIDPEAGAQQ